MAIKQKKDLVIHDIEPVFDGNSHILILGTMPSPASRSVGFYYGHPQNRFWKVMERLFGEPIVPTTEAKQRFLLRHHIALWDVLASCEIIGASDSTITSGSPNALDRILNAASIRQIFTTGAKATRLYKSLCEPIYKRTCRMLPSTSSANAQMSLDELVAAYQVIMPYIEE
ncbi:MAG: DNA-deoxyinosine glycosylase [Eggerthellaceae bacterium]|nr:DNA-deoxyinosine glycosylase [Eggerthellaceae bacterium]